MLASVWGGRDVRIVANAHAVECEGFVEHRWRIDWYGAVKGVHLTAPSEERLEIRIV